jgi:hypothetical protein
MARIASWEDAQQALSRPCPVIPIRPWRKRPTLEVLVRPYSLGELMQWRRGRPCIGYAEDGRTLKYRPERWPQAVLENCCFLPPQIEGGPYLFFWDFGEGRMIAAPEGDCRGIPTPAPTPLFAGPEGARLWRALEQNASGVIDALKNTADIASGLYLVAVGADQTPHRDREAVGAEPGSVPAEPCSDPDPIAALIRDYSSPARQWIAGIFPGDLEAEFHIGPYQTSDWADAQLAAARQTGFDLDFGLPCLLKAAWRAADGSPILPPDQEEWVWNRLPYGTAVSMANEAGKLAELQAVPWDFFDQSKERRPWPG